MQPSCPQQEPRGTHSRFEAHTAHLSLSVWYGILCSRCCSSSVRSPEQPGRINTSTQPAAAGAPAPLGPGPGPDRPCASAAQAPAPSASCRSQQRNSRLFRTLKHAPCSPLKCEIIRACTPSMHRYSAVLRARNQLAQAHYAACRRHFLNTAYQARKSPATTTAVVAS